ncbi:MAG: tyrosine-type recombinase/integrase [Clostridiales bacterium]|nr:tyrosine-type recombinase/integrase [Clostridiales bacterium]
MNIGKIRDKYVELFEHMQQDKYSEAYIRELKTEINWLLKNYNQFRFKTYEDAYNERAKNSFSKDMKRRYRLIYGILMRFDLYNEFPDRQRKRPLIRKDAYSKLNSYFKNRIDLYLDKSRECDLKESTLRGNASNTSCFFLDMQNKGFTNLDELNEETVMSFFTNDEGELVFSSSYKKAIASVLKSSFGVFDESAKKVLAFLPTIRPRRKNIQYLTSEEVNHIHKALDEDGTLSLRDKAIGLLLFFTGIRGCDIAQIQFSSIDWEREIITLNQKKTSNNLVLPLTVTIGNAIYEYIKYERPISIDSHVFLNEVVPNTPIKAKAIWLVTSRIYKEAGVRQKIGDRRGTHLFRYNLVTSLAEKNVPRPVISDTLGHTDPCSLNHYLFTDMVHLRECALSIEDFPIRKEVFKV